MTGPRQSSVAKAASNSGRPGATGVAPGALQQDLSNSSKGRSPRVKAPHPPAYLNAANARKMQSGVATTSQLAGRTSTGKLMQSSAQARAQNLQLQKQQSLHKAQMQQLHARQQAAQNSRPSSSRQMPVSGNTLPANMQAPPGHPLKRSRSSSMNSREMDAKRSKVGAGGVAKSQQSQGNTHRSVPQSPTSSRSRSVKHKAGATQAGQDSANSAATAPHPQSGMSGTTTATFHPGSRQRMQNGKARQAAGRQPVGRHANQVISSITIDGIPVPSNVKVTDLPGRIFGHEIQCMMHAFGEARACTRDTLEIVEDSVRDTVRRLAWLAVSVATEGSPGNPPQAEASPQKPILLEAHHVVHLIRRDARAVDRLNQSLKTVIDHGPESDARVVREYLQDATFKAEPTNWELLSELLALPEDKEEPERQDITVSDLSKVCTWRAYIIFRGHHHVMHTTFTDYAKCRSTNFVTGVSRNPTPNLFDHPRIGLLHTWLAMENVKITIPAMYALGHIAWETVGVLTQRALVEKYFDDLKSGYGDARSIGWSYPRHILAALSHGIATAIMVPLSDTQLLALRQEVEQLPFLMRAAQNSWRGGSTGSRCLQPQHIREAIRRVEDKSGSTILNVLRGE